MSALSSSPQSRFRSLCIALLAAPLIATAANRDIYLYQGADRAERLAVEAKKEGSLVLYSTMTLEDVFRGRWPGQGVRWEFEGTSSADYDFSKNVRLE